MGLLPEKKRRILLTLCNLSALLAPLGWLHFAVLTRNSFRLNEFNRKDLALCVVCGLIPAVCSFFAWFSQRRGPVLRGWIPACGGFVLAAAGWIITLATQWPLWDAACTAEAIDTAQRNLLRWACAMGLTTALGALTPAVTQVAVRRQ